MTAAGPPPHAAWKARVAARFGAAAPRYDSAAGIQRSIAQALAESITRTIAARPRAEALRVAEIGCGSGFLTAALLPHLAPRRWLATDVAIPMLSATRARLKTAAPLEMALMDGEYPTLQAGVWDLICSSLAVQWFADLNGGLRRLFDALAPDGLLGITTLGAGSFAPWAAACAAEGLGSFVSRYPTTEALATLCPGAQVTAREWPLGTAPGNPTAFLGALRAMGADTPPPDQPRTSPGALRRALRRLPDGDGGRYQVLTLLWRKPSDCLPLYVKPDPGTMVQGRVLSRYPGGKSGPAFPHAV